jgi:phage baseplate assembly protein gpV
VRLLADLAARVPDDEGLAAELKVQRAQAAAGGARVEGPAVYGTSARIREVYRDPCVAVQMEGRKKRWLAFDTGSEVILLNEDLVRKWKLPTVAEQSLVGWGNHGNRRTRAILVRFLEVAGRTLHNVPALVNSRDSEFWTNKAGYFGLGPFLDGAVLYDRRRGRFALYGTGEEAQRALGGRGFSLPAFWIRGVPVVPVLLKAGDGLGGGLYPFMVDTGAPFSLLALGPARNMGVRIDSTRYPKIYGLGVSGAFTSSLAERITLGLGPKQYLRPAMPVTDIAQRLPVPLYGVLGRDILNDYAMVFDGPGNRIVFVPYD